MPGAPIRRRAAVIFRPAGEADFAAYIRRFKGSPSIKGVRRGAAGDIAGGAQYEQEFVRGTGLLGELGLHFELCMRHADLPDATKLVDACPDTRFILDHCGNPDLKKNDQ
ncbi:MAG: amidohydrolase family protein [Gemmataceae bacterium]